MALVVFMFNSLRQMEHWLHQHIFKLGWLLTRDFYITTILYYTFFLPGIVVYELVYWLAAGILDVRAERAISIPEKQEIGELRLNFVKLSKKAPAYKLEIINVMPLVVGLAMIWFVASNLFDAATLSAIYSESSGTVLSRIAAAIRYLVSVPDFWLWSYFIFTIANTMMPNTTIFRKWWWVFLAGVAATILLLLIGAGDVVTNVLTGPLATGLNSLSAIFGMIIIVDLTAIVILGSIEALFEWATGHSATFKNGKMIVMTRAEAIELRKQEREKERIKQRKPAASPTETGRLPSVYKLSFPIPGPPGQEPVSQSLSTILEADEQETVPQKPRREEPSVVPGTASQPEMRINLPGRDRQADNLIENTEDKNSDDDDEFIYEDVEDSV